MVSVGGVRHTEGAMFHISVIGYKPSNWSNSFSAILKTRRMMKAARTAPGFLRANTFRKNDISYVYIVWDGKAAMQFYETASLFRTQKQDLIDLAEFAASYNFVCEQIPTQRQVHEMWRSARYVLPA